MNIANRPKPSRLVEGSDLTHSAPSILIDGGPLRDQTLTDSATSSLQNQALVTWYSTDMPAGHEVPRHHHHRAQLLYAVSGIMIVVTDTGRWTVPPQQAVWIPAGVSHEVRMPCAIHMRSLYLRPELVDDLPQHCQVVAVSALLRELISSLVTTEHRSVDRLMRLMGVLIDEIRSLESPPLHLPAPRDQRLRRITDALTDEPADSRELGEWSLEVGASARTLARLFVKETGMGFRAWRQQRRLLAAIEKLAAGEDVTRVALDLGYGSPSAFIAMFRRSLGSTPGQFLKLP